MRSLRWAAAAVALITMSSVAAAHSAADRKISRNAETRALMSPTMQDQSLYGSSDGHRHSANAKNDVHVGGIYVGSDPDPRIRMELIREYYQRQW